MATVTTPTSELEAINVMLGVIGESPVSSLVDTGLADVSNAIQVFNETNREVQSFEWDFNSEEDYPLVRDSFGYIPVPPNALKLDITTKYRSKYAPVVRGAKLYDKLNHTFIFPEDIEVDIVWLLPFTDAPEAVRRYITVAAARKFQKRFYSSDTLDGFTHEDEALARAEALSQDSWTADYNMAANYSVASIIQR